MFSKSSQPLENADAYSFCEFTFNIKNKVLFRDENVITLPPKACELLSELIKNAGQIITREDLLERVWSETFVEEANLTHHISALRKALGEDKNGRKFIETIPRKGYRFVAEVTKTSNLKQTEIIISERTVANIVEETTIEQDDLTEVGSTSSATEKLIGETRGSNVEDSRKKTRSSLAASAAVGGFLLITFGAWFIGARGGFQSADKNAPTSEITVKRLTPDADIYSTAVSPDGASVVFTAKEKNTVTLWRKSLATGEMSQLLPTGGKFSPPSVMHFAPDGKWIYYMGFNESIKKDCIFRIPANGGVPQMLVENPFTDFAVSHDGKYLGYVTDSKLIVRQLENGNEKVLAESKPKEREFFSLSAMSLAFSPDDKRIVVPSKKLNGETGETEYPLVEFDIESGAESTIPVPKDFRVRQIEWLPDGKSLLVTHNVNPALPLQIWRVSYPDGAATRVSPADLSFRNISLTADGKTIVGLETISHYNIWRAPTADISQRKQISVGARAQHGVDGLIYLSGGKILYTSPQSGNLDLWTMNETGDDRRQLTVNAGSYNAEPQLTADKRYIVFVSNRTGTPQIWRIDDDGGNPRQLTENAKETTFQLSFDNWIYLLEIVPETKQRRFYKISVEDGTRQELESQKFPEFPFFSPDGKWRLRPNEDSVEKFDLIDAATGKIVRTLDCFDAMPTWWSDSMAITELNTFEGKLYRVPIDGSPRRTFVDFSPETMLKFSFSPDGASFVYSLGSSTNEVTLIQNF